MAFLSGIEGEVEGDFEEKNMSWLRLDDGFASNKKIASLTDREFRVWLRLMCWCAKEQDPTVDELAIREVKGLTRRIVGRYAELQLLDEVNGSFEIHDWVKYLPRDATGAERQARWRARQKGVTVETVTDSLASRARPRARPRPVPKEEELTKNVSSSSSLTAAPSKETSSTSKKRPPDALWDELEAHFGKVAAGTNAHAKRNKAVKDLKLHSATVESIRRAVRQYRQSFPDVACTDTALATHYPALSLQSETGAERLRRAMAERGVT